MKSKNLSGIQVICSPCPLISKIPTLNNPLARRCGEIIENARHIWGYLSPEEQSVYYEVIDGEEVPKKFPPYSNFKLTSARSIRNWYVEHSDLMLTNQKTPEAIRKAVQDVRRYARPGIDNDITDKEILAIFAICEAFDAIHSIQQGKPEEAIKEKVLSASMFLNLAKTGFEPEKQTPASTPEENSYVLDNANYLHIDRIPIKLEPSCADLLRFITRELKDNDFLELQYILAYHYGDIEAMSKMTLSKSERQPFEKEKYKINSLCEEILKKDLIKSLGNKKFTLSLNIKLPKNSPKDFP